MGRSRTQNSGNKIDFAKRISPVLVLRPSLSLKVVLEAWERAFDDVTNFVQDYPGPRGFFLFLKAN